MTYCVDDTIAAIASAPGGAVRGVVRISGPNTLRCLQRCFRPASGVELEAVKQPRRLAGDLVADPPVSTLPCDLYLWPTRRSYTREPSAELHTIGSPPLLDAALRSLCRQGARLAQPGEFTLRAFLAGRLDLTQAEAVLGVVDAEDARSLRVALAQLAGGLSHPLKQLRSELLDLLADIEAGLDFVDEDIEFVGRQEVARKLRHARTSVESLLQRIAHRGDSTCDVRVVLRGWPNVGKSSLLNALSGVDAAIVSRRAGTTRDYVTRQFDWDGAAGMIVDTPGFDDQDSSDALAAAAQHLAGQQAETADLELLCLDAHRPLNAWEQRMLDAASARPRLLVWTKCDLCPATDHAAAREGVRTSSRTGEGIQQLRSLIAHTVMPVRSSPGGVVASTAQRCRQCLELSAESLRNSYQLIVDQQGDELVAMELREALEQLGQVIGAVYTDDLLDRIFSRFCIGK